MGDVYRATSTSDRRPVALKLEGAAVALDQDNGLRERFLREARILQGLDHENLPEFFEAGELPDGRLFIAMELLVGRPLSKLARTKPETLVPLLVQAASALQAVSEAGVVHRDVSPDNFFVVEVGGRSVVKLIDFGISRDIEAARDGLTRVGSFVGKPSYCSPEQTGLLPGSPAVDWRTDLYSFGLTIYFLVKGNLPFPPGTVLDLLRARLQQLPETAFDGIEGTRLRRLVARLLRLEPDDRPDSFEEVVTELLHVQADLAAETARRMEESWKHRRKTTGRGRRSEPAGAAATTAAPRDAPPPSRAEAVSHPGQAGLAPAWLAPRALLAASATIVGAVVLLLALGAIGRKSIEASALILLALALAAVAAMRERAVRRAAGSTPDAGTEGSVPDYAGDPSEGEPLPFSLLVSGDGPDRLVRVVRARGAAAGAPIRIGRSVGPDEIYLATKTVSGVQALLSSSPEGYRVENASSTNPTLVNAKPLGPGERRLLREGDRIQIAAITLTYRTVPSRPGALS